MFAQAAASWRLLRWGASAALLMVFLALHAAPLAFAFSPRDCGCNCPRSSHTCCCRRNAQSTDTTGLRWNSVSCCHGHCPRATPGPVTFTAFLLAPGPGRAVLKTDARPLPASLFDCGRHSSCLDLAFLFQRPPPLA